MYVNQEGVVILLEDEEGRIAFQLRDDKPGVVGRGLWGLFGGLMKGEESSEQAIVREIGEELGYSLDVAKLSLLRLHKTDYNLKTYVFHYPCPEGLNNAILSEGQALEFMGPTDLKKNNIASHHREIVEWYWKEKAEGRISNPDGM